jgi:hypothetical protein
MQKKYVLTSIAALLAVITAETVATASEVTTNRRREYSSRPQPQSNDWMGFAISRNGRAFISDDVGQHDAIRNAEHQLCERTTAHPCTAIAMQSIGYVAFAHCREGRTQGGFVGGSNENMGAARWVALDKARQAGFDTDVCTIVREWE